jgi:hypothetical protein
VSEANDPYSRARREAIAREAARLGAIGATLQRAGLTARGLAAWAGHDHLPLLVDRAPRLPAEPVAARVLAAFVAGARVALEPALAGELRAAALWDDRGATCALLPLAHALLVCDRLPVGADPDALCWPDDSSYHLARALPPGRHARWLDLGTGSGFAPLSRPGLAAHIAGADLNPRAADAIARGAALSGIGHVAAFVSDLADALPAAYRACDLVSFNAPIPDGDHATRWRAAPRSVLDRAWPAIASCLAPGGLAVVHCAVDAIPDTLAGERVTVIYTPREVARAFAVTWWQPSAAPRQLVTRRALSPDEPHLHWADRERALAAC